MPLCRMDDLMIAARKNGAALGAFECWDSLNVQGIAMAAARCNSAVIFQATPVEYNLMGGPDALADIVKFYVNKYNIAAALHLDHGSTIEHVKECLASGFTSVMLDASVCEFDKNVELSREAAALAAECNASSEAELGHVGGGGDGGANSESVLTVPEEAAEFVRLTKVSTLAVAIGTVHGEYVGKPELRLDRLEKIAASVDVPLVLHGGSGTPKDLLQKAIKLGIAKINICTDISKAFLRGIDEAKATRTPSLAGSFYRPAMESLADKTEEMIRLFRCEN